MKLLKILVVLGVLVIGLGLYRGWFSVSRMERDPESNQVGVNISVDPDKVNADVAETKKKAIELVPESTDKDQIETEQDSAVKRID